MDQIVDQADVLLERLLLAMGKGDASAAERAKLARDLRSLKTLYEQQVRRITSVESGRETIDHKRELLQKLLAKKAECGTYETAWYPKERHPMRRDISHERS